MSGSDCIPTIRSFGSLRRAPPLVMTTHAPTTIFANSSDGRGPSLSSEAAPKRFPQVPRTVFPDWLSPSCTSDAAWCRRPKADVANAVAAFTSAASLSPPDGTLSPGQQLGAALVEAGAPEAIRAACNDGTDDNPTVVPQTIDALAEIAVSGGAAGARCKRRGRTGHVPVCGPVSRSHASPADARSPVLPQCPRRMGMHQPRVQRRALD